ncbi:hypothetical protein [Flavobacterium sp. HNIBRBA15423]|uniref:hypothetical protein n=1 Tax=Flavobacterium sp. HNIBRBA15423 TaxID=3458683 RepID=UPI00404438E6
MTKRSSLFFLILLFLSSCSTKTFDTTEEIFAFLSDEENGYCYTKEINGVNYTLQYRPTDVLVQQELGDSNSKEQVEKLRKKYGKQLYFNLSMSLNGQELLSNVVKDKAQFGQMVNDLAFNMDEKVHVFTPEKDTLAMTDFVYPRMYGMTNSTTILIVYPRDKNYLKEDYLNFTIEDLGLYTGEVKFKVQTQPLKNEPKLNL